MRFRRQRLSGGSPSGPRLQSVTRRRCRPPEDGSTSDSRSALDSWLELTGSDRTVDPEQLRSSEVAALRERLLAVLADDTGTASMPPPTAGGMSQEDWDALPEAERRVLRGRQLRSLDPRLLPRSVANPSGPFDRSPRSANR
jgi:hypothetical protein